MGQQFDLSQFLVNPKHFAFDNPNSQVSEEFMTEMVAADLPGNFNAARACDIYEEIMEDLDPDYTPHLFMVVGNKGLSNLLITFRDAVDIAAVTEPIQDAIRQEIENCGQDSKTWKLKTHPLTEGVFDIIYHYYEHGFNGPQ